MAPSLPCLVLVSLTRRCVLPCSPAYPGGGGERACQGRAERPPLAPLGPLLGLQHLRLQVLHTLHTPPTIRHPAGLLFESQRAVDATIQSQGHTIPFPDQSTNRWFHANAFPALTLSLSPLPMTAPAVTAGGRPPCPRPWPRPCPPPHRPTRRPRPLTRGPRRPPDSPPPRYSHTSTTQSLTQAFGWRFQVHADGGRCALPSHVDPPRSYTLFLACVPG
jgi:hypothetical protein